MVVPPQLNLGQAVLFTHDLLDDGLVDGSQFPLLHVTLRDCVPEPPPQLPEQLP